MCRFTTEDYLKKHEVVCIQVNKSRITLPDENEKVFFRNNNNKERVPFIIYSDIESLLKPTDNPKAFQEHEAYSIGFYLHCSFNPELCRYESYRQTDEMSQTPADWFIDQLCEVKKLVEETYADIKPMKLTKEDWLYHRTCKKCHICNRVIQPGEKRARDHCHLTGR